MNKSQLIDTVNSFLIDEFEVDESDIVADANLQETLDLDSLDYVDLVVIIESNFGFKATGEDFQSIVTFQDFYNFLCQKIKCDQ